MEKTVVYTKGEVPMGGKVPKWQNKHC